MNFCPRCRADQPLYGIGWCLECGWTLVPVWGGFSICSPFAGIPLLSPELLGVLELKVSSEEIDALIRESGRPPIP